jgi:hypothetical protein
MKCLAGLLICIAGCFPTLADTAPPVFTVTSLNASSFTGIVTMSGPGFSLSGHMYLGSHPGDSISTLPGDNDFISGVNGWAEDSAVHGVVGGITYGTAGGPVTNLCGGLIFDAGPFSLPDGSVIGEVGGASAPTGLSSFSDTLLPGVTGGCAGNPFSPAFELDVSRLAPIANLSFTWFGTDSEWEIEGYTLSEGTFTPVPEPTTLPLLASLLFAAGMGRALRRKVLQPGHRFLFR